MDRVLDPSPPVPLPARVAARSRPLDRPERDRPPFELPQQRPHRPETPVGQARAAREQKDATKADRSAEADLARIDAPAPSTPVAIDSGSVDDAAVADENGTEPVPTAPPVPESPFSHRLPPVDEASRLPVDGAPLALPQPGSAVSNAPRPSAALALPPAGLAHQVPVEVAALAKPAKAAVLTLDPEVPKALEDATVPSLTALAPTDTGLREEALASSVREDELRRAEAATASNQALGALLALAQAASAQTPVVVGPGGQEPTAEAAAAAHSADRTAAAVTARRVDSALEGSSPQTSEPAAIPVPTTEASRARHVPTAASTFGEHLAKVSTDGFAQVAQGGDSLAATVRVDLAPPTLPHAAGPLLGATVPTVASPHVAAPAHPVVSGVPIQAVPVEIGLKSLAGINRFDIRLDPDDLGQIDVRLDISGEGHVRAHIVVERPEALLSLQRETSQLERALEQAGFRTGDEGVSMSLRQQAQGESGGRGADREAATQSPAARNDEQAAEAQPVRRYSWGHASGIDRHI